MPEPSASRPEFELYMRRSLVVVVVTGHRPDLGHGALR
jgi:hypothetical protein